MALKEAKTIGTGAFIRAAERDIHVKNTKQPPMRQKTKEKDDETANNC